MLVLLTVPKMMTTTTVHLLTNVAPVPLSWKACSMRSPEHQWTWGHTPSRCHEREAAHCRRWSSICQPHHVGCSRLHHYHPTIFATPSCLQRQGLRMLGTRRDKHPSRRSMFMLDTKNKTTCIFCSRAFVLWLIVRLLFLFIFVIRGRGTRKKSERVQRSKKNKKIKKQDRKISETDHKQNKTKGGNMIRKMRTKRKKRRNETRPNKT